MSTYTRARIMGETSDCFFNGGDLESVWIAGYGRGTDPGDGGDCPSSGGGYQRSGRFLAFPNCGAIPFNGWSPKSPFIREVVVDSGDRTALCGRLGGAHLCPLRWPGDRGGPLRGEPIRAIRR